MGKRIRLPDEEELPAGPVREFTEEIWRLYKDARRPPLREIEKDIHDRSDLKGTASKETVRQMLKGHAPQNWETAEAVAVVLRERARENSRSYVHGFSLDRVHDLWDAALEEEDPPEAATGTVLQDPWARHAEETGENPRQSPSPQSAPRPPSFVRPATQEPKDPWSTPTTDPFTEWQPGRDWEAATAEGEHRDPPF